MWLLRRAPSHLGPHPRAQLGAGLYTEYKATTDLSCGAAEPVMELATKVADDDVAITNVTLPACDEQGTLSANGLQRAIERAVNAALLELPAGAALAADDPMMPRYLLHGWHRALDLSSDDFGGERGELWTSSASAAFWPSLYCFASRVSFDGGNHIYMRATEGEEPGAWADLDGGSRRVLGYIYLLHITADDAFAPEDAATAAAAAAASTRKLIAGLVRVCFLMAFFWLVWWLVGIGRHQPPGYAWPVWPSLFLGFGAMVMLVLLPKTALDTHASPVVRKVYGAACGFALGNFAAFGLWAAMCEGRTTRRAPSPASLAAVPCRGPSASSAPRPSRCRAGSPTLAARCMRARGRI